MSTWSRSEESRTIIRYTMPAPGPQGATWSEVQAALEAAIVEARQVNGGVLSDDSLRVKPEDGRIVFYFEMPGKPAP